MRAHPNGPRARTNSDILSTSCLAGLEFAIGVAICLLSDVAAAVHVLVVSYFGTSVAAGS